MKRVAPVVLVVGWALWFGGIVTLLVGVSAIFNEYGAGQRQAAGRATAAMFRALGMWELAFAAAALVGAAIVRLKWPSTTRTVLFVLLAMSAALAAYTTGVVTPKIEAMRVAQETQSDAFKKLHGRSMGLFAGRTLMLLMAGLMLPTVVRVDDDVRATHASPLP
jgi:ABC-type multidrug transport system fused ATPase/permease subunit